MNQGSEIRFYGLGVGIQGLSRGESRQKRLNKTIHSCNISLFREREGQGGKGRGEGGWGTKIFRDEARSKIS